MLPRFLIHSPLMAEEPGAATGGAARTLEVELGANKISLPEDQAKGLIAWRDDQKKQARELTERLGALETSSRAAEESKRKATEEAELSNLKNKGQYDEALKRVESSNNQKISSLAVRYRDRALESLIARTPGILPEAVADVARQLSGACSYDLDSDALVPSGADGKPRLGADGRPLTVEAVVADFLASRPYFRTSTGSPGSGATGGGQVGAGGPAKMTSAEYESAVKDPGRAQKVAQDLAAKRLIIVE